MLPTAALAAGGRPTPADARSAFACSSSKTFRTTSSLVILSEPGHLWCLLVVEP
jgi:hypothetical protein